MKKWATEINLWASMPDGTEVWEQTILSEWNLVKEPVWAKHYIYVVADNNAEVIKQWYDDKNKLEYLEENGSWTQSKASIERIRENLLDDYEYRTKPQEIYYYIWEKLRLNGEISISNPISDDYAKSSGYENDKWRKVISSKRVWDEI